MSLFPVAARRKNRFPPLVVAIALKGLRRDS